MTRVLALAGQSKIGLSRSGGSPKPGPKPIRNGVPLWTETACRFPPKPPAGLNRNRLSETPKFAGKEAGLVISCARVPLGEVAGKLSLDRVPQRLIDDRRVFARVELALVNDLASVNAVLQHQVERAARERPAADEAPGNARPQLTFDPARFQLVLQQSDRAEFGIAAENQPNGIGLAVDHDELVILHSIPERRHATHPHPLLLRGGDLVANALADYLALELREGQQNVEGQAPHRGRRVELLRHRYEGRALGIEDLDDLGKIGERAGQPVDLVDDHRVDAPRRDVLKQPLQSRPVHRRAGEPAVIISRVQAHPAFVPLAVDEGLAGFALRLQRIELLLEPLLGRFAGVDHTTDGSVLPHCGSWLFHWLASATRMHALACRDQRTVAPTNVPR